MQYVWFYFIFCGTTGRSPDLNFPTGALKYILSYLEVISVIIWWESHWNWNLQTPGPPQCTDCLLLLQSNTWLYVLFICDTSRRCKAVRYMLVIVSASFRYSWIGGFYFGLDLVFFNWNWFRWREDVFIFKLCIFHCVSIITQLQWGVTFCG